MKKYHLSYEFHGVLMEHVYNSYPSFMRKLNEVDESPNIPQATIDFRTEVTTVKEATKPITETLAQ